MIVHIRVFLLKRAAINKTRLTVLFSEIDSRWKFEDFTISYVKVTFNNKTHNLDGHYVCDYR